MKKGERPRSEHEPREPRQVYAVKKSQQLGKQLAEEKGEELAEAYRQGQLQREIATTTPGIAQVTEEISARVGRAAVGHALRRLIPENERREIKSRTYRKNLQRATAGMDRRTVESTREKKIGGRHDQWSAEEVAEMYSLLQNPNFRHRDTSVWNDTPNYDAIAQELNRRNHGGESHWDAGSISNKVTQDRYRQRNATRPKRVSSRRQWSPEEEASLRAYLNDPSFIYSDPRHRGVPNYGAIAEALNRQYHGGEVQRDSQSVRRKLQRDKKSE